MGRENQEKTLEEDGYPQAKKEAAEGTNLAGTLLLQLDLQNYEKNKFLVFKPPSPWYFAMAALTNSYGDGQNYNHLFHLFEPILTETLLCASYSGKMLV